MTRLEFLIADLSSPAWRSPLRRALACAPEGIRDVTALVDQSQVARLAPAAAVAGIELEGPEARRLMRRLTDLDLDALPAIGAVAQVRTLVAQQAEDSFRLWFPQEYADYVAGVVLDTAEGVGWA
jgi:sarcosine oxidase gamma subunit